MVLIASSISYGFGNPFAQGDRMVQGGIGIVLPGMPGHMTVPPIGAGFEYGFHDLVSGGAFFALSGYEGAGPHMVFSLAGEANFHPFNLPAFPEFGLKDQLDAYAGGLLGLNVITATPSRFLWGIIAGCRYYFRERFGVYAEVGRGIGWINIGVTVKL
jgi:hypothetical protein